MNDQVDLFGPLTRRCWACGAQPGQKCRSTKPQTDSEGHWLKNPVYPEMDGWYHTNRRSPDNAPKETK